MNDIEDYLLEESTNEYLETGDSEYLVQEDESFFFSRSSIRGEFKNERINTEEFVDIISNYSNKETFYIQAIKNLLKQKEYINLLYQLSSELINVDEFSEELDKNENKYLIKIDKDLTTNSYKAILNILENLQEEFTEDDVSEIFSLKTGYISKHLRGNREIEK